MEKKGKEKEESFQIGIRSYRKYTWYPMLVELSRESFRIIDSNW